ncbi:hypothetical protein, partial [Stenotrophomonas maltophilia]|uniref:hypothetical protein n=1 Tax=Stenotrophomonas maltophilia TaxID=40324 RepID=UPI0019535D96
SALGKSGSGNGEGREQGRGEDELLHDGLHGVVRLAASASGRRFAVMRVKQAPTPGSAKISWTKRKPRTARLRG